MTSTTSDGSEPFAAAWEHVRRAKDALGSLSEIWNSACSEVFGVHIVTTTSRAGEVGEITVDLDLDETTRKLLNDTGRQVGTLLRQALDTGVVALAQLVSGAIVPPDPTVVHFPVAETLNGFLDDYDGGALDGIRPDQVQFIQGLQPFNADVSATGTPSVLRFLRALIDHPSSADVVTPWAHLAEPEVWVDRPSVAAIVSVEPDGPITHTKTIATFQATHPPELSPEARPTVYGNPNVAFDLMSAVGCAPTGPEDTFGRRGRATFAAVTLILQAFERSMGLREGVVDHWDPAARLETASTSPLNWAPLLPDQERAAEATNAVHLSEVGIASIGDGRELTLVVDDGDSIHLRQVAAAKSRLPRAPQTSSCVELIALSMRKMVTVVKTPTAAHCLTWSRNTAQ